MNELAESDKKVLEYINKIGEFESRLKETDSGDSEFLQRGIPPNINLSEQELIYCLHNLESKGYLRREQKVHEYDTSEYILKWQITSKGENALTV